MGTLSGVLRSYDGDVLTLMSVQRTDMGAYLCIASNGVPPSVSKRFNVIVHLCPKFDPHHWDLGNVYVDQSEHKTMKIFLWK
ncbi:hypothetical protein NQ315_014278 [Exocentrus adspersus]|uniref:Uncharacterized protein n=1 Tax=Exocentrus adspersus TaxID=1586481 RepID=A0AAV8VIQ7_9CUCU|nr:hypothetical protein NQ315_014278 [Exocentrus adspersus]